MTGFVNAFLKLVRGLKETILNFFKPTVAQLYLLFIFAQNDLKFSSFEPMTFRSFRFC